MDNWKTPAAIALGIAGGLIGLGTLVQALTGWKFIPVLAGDDSFFFCQQQLYGNELAWTIVHQKGPVGKNWMRMVHEFGGDWNQGKRCETIADRLETFRKDGLIALDYRQDPVTPSQWVICAKTKKSQDNCPLLVTLKPGEDPYKAFSSTFGALLQDNYVDRGSGPQTQNGKPVTTIDLRGRL